MPKNEQAVNRGAAFTPLQRLFSRRYEKRYECRAPRPVYGEQRGPVYVFRISSNQKLCSGWSFGIFGRMVLSWRNNTRPKNNVPVHCLSNV